MSDAMSIAVSGLTAATLRIVNATSNIVNVSSTTPDGKKFQPSDVSVKTNAVSGNNLGVTAELQLRAEGSEVDLASELVDINVAAITYKANAAIIKTIDEMEKKLLDTIT
ncbi:MAG: flagellar basal body rod C-terminal domain-containing protein [Alphaproteobacteria bacterium]|nr:flagellar basal body rod C-terminal domain-containing protein [Alphaproteobacteria bacterium]